MSLNESIVEDAALEWFGALPRKLRVEFPGAIYHVMGRGIAARTFSWTMWIGRIS